MKKIVELALDVVVSAACAAATAAAVHFIQKFAEGFLDEKGE